jgi:signal transduction histidine kinase
MQERVARLGGTCVVDSAPGRGTSVTVTLPLHRALLVSASRPLAGSVLGIAANG